MSRPCSCAMPLTCSPPWPISGSGSWPFATTAMSPMAAFTGSCDGPARFTCCAGWRGPSRVAASPRWWLRHRSSGLLLKTIRQQVPIWTPVPERAWSCLWAPRAAALVQSCPALQAGIDELQLVRVPGCGCQASDPHGWGGDG